MSDQSLQPILVLLSESAAGNPSQYMFEKAFEQCDLDWRYATAEVSPEELEDAVRGIRAMGFAGGNCARGHNRLVGPLLDRLETVAERTGSVNLVWRDKADLVGDNTEGKGVLAAVRARRESPVRRLLLFGAGDLGRAVAVEAAEAGAKEIVVVNRTLEQAESLVETLAAYPKLAARVLAWDAEADLPEEIDLVVNATPVGTEGTEGCVPLDWNCLAAGAVVVDGNLEETQPPLLVKAAERQLATANGLDVFLEQAAIGFRKWTGIDPDRTVMRETVEEFLEL